MNVSHCLPSLWPRVMIAQWKNGCISLSALPVAWVMITQWENQCIALSPLPMARVMIAQWKNDCISLSVLPVAQVEFLAIKEYFKGFPWLITLCQPILNHAAWQKVAQSQLDTTHPVDNEEVKVQLWTDNG